MDNSSSGILKESKTIAIIGLSDNPERISYQVAKYLKDHGFKIIPINPNINETLGEKAYSDLLSIPNDIKIDIVDIFRKSDQVMMHIKEIIKRGDIKLVWLEVGASSKEAEQFARDHGLNVVSNFCIMEVHKKIQSNSKKNE